MPYPFHKIEVGSETGIEKEYSPKVQKVEKKDNVVGTMLVNIFQNLVDIVRILIKWR